MKSSATELYDKVAAESASVVIRRYSTSFALATRMLGGSIRQHVENVYALVRIADEVVDGGAAMASDGADAVLRQLDGLEAETERALACGYSTNLVVHAFAQTARRSGFGTELTRPFFSSMRADINPATYDQTRFEEYIYGSAEVVGLMCLHAFLVHEPQAATTYRRLEPGARHLGAAFQKVNFLRDLSADFRTLGRCYFPGIDPARLTDGQKNALLDDVDADLALSLPAIQELPASSRRAVALAHGLFAELSRRLRLTPAADLLQQRVRVPNPVKVRIAAGAALGRPKRAAEVTA